MAGSARCQRGKPASALVSPWLYEVGGKRAATPEIPPKHECSLKNCSKIGFGGRPKMAQKCRKSCFFFLFLWDPPQKLIFERERDIYIYNIFLSYFNVLGISGAAARSQRLAPLGAYDVLLGL